MNKPFHPTRRCRPIVRRALGSGFEPLEARIAMSADGMAPIAGNWDGIGFDGVGFYDRGDGQVYLRESNSPGFATQAFSLATPSASLAPVAGDWDANGATTLGIYDWAGGTFSLRNQNLPGAADIAFGFGGSGETLLPLVGDWDGDGHDSIGVFDTRTGTFTLKNALQAGAADYVLSLAAPASALMPLSGDWDGDGRDSVGLYNTATGEFAYCNDLDDVAILQELSFASATAGVVPIAGDWNNDGRDTIGLYEVATAKFTLNVEALSNSATTVFYVAPAVAAITASESTVLPLITAGPSLDDALKLASSTIGPAAPTDNAQTTEAVLNSPVALAGPSPQLSLSDVDQLLKRAVAASSSIDAIIAVVDRNGNILGVRMEQGVLNAIPDTATRVFAIDGAVAKARTAALFASGDPTNGTVGTAGPLTSRTVRFISQSTITQREVESNPNVADPNSTIRGPGFVAPIGLGGHFPPGVMNAPVADLFGIEHTNRDSLIHPGLDSIKGTADDIPLPTRFNVDPAYIPVGQEISAPESFGFVSGLLPNAQARGIATLPGGIPLYKADASGNPYMVGGIGVFFPGTTGYATSEQGFVPGIGQTEAQRTNAPRVLEAEYIAFAAAGGIRFGTAVAGTVIGNLGTVTPVPPVPGIGLVSGRIDLAGITLEIYGPGNPLTQGPQTLLAVGAQVGQAADGLSGIADQYISPTPGQPVPDGWLVLPHGSGSITTTDVQTIINQGIAEAMLDRSAIRLQLTSPNPTPGARTRMTFAVSDKDGNILGLYRMQDGTVFSIDVAVAKSRNTAYYADAAELQPIDRVDDNGDGLPDPSVPAGASFTNRTFRFLAEGRYPSGIDGTASGAFSIMRDPGFKTNLLASTNPLVNSNAVENAGAPQPASVFQSAYGFDSFHPGRNFHDPFNIANQNGVVFFPGSTPLYKNSILAGGFGVSGDGVDQDDVVTFYGSKGFQAPTALRADQYFVRGVRLVYQNFPRNPRA